MQALAEDQLTPASSWPRSLWCSRLSATCCRTTGVSLYQACFSARCFSWHERSLITVARASKRILALAAMPIELTISSIYVSAASVIAVIALGKVSYFHCRLKRSSHGLPSTEGVEERRRA